MRDAFAVVAAPRLAAALTSGTVPRPATLLFVLANTAEHFFADPVEAAAVSAEVMAAGLLAALLWGDAGREDPERAGGYDRDGRESAGTED